MVRLGFVGTGFIAHYHAFMLTRCSEPHELVAVHDADAERAEGFAASWSCTALPTLERLLDAVDAVFVCTWTAAHEEAVAAAAGRGMPIFCEKPLATNLAGARRMTELVRSAGVVNQVGLVLRTMPALLALREWVRDTDANGRSP